MNVKIKINKKGLCDKFELNNKDIRNSVTGYRIVQDAGVKPQLVISIQCDVINFESENIEKKDIRVTKIEKTKPVIKK
jgi:hypothetical protein